MTVNTAMKNVNCFMTPSFRAMLISAEDADTARYELHTPVTDDSHRITHIPGAGQSLIRTKKSFTKTKELIPELTTTFQTQTTGG